MKMSHQQNNVRNFVIIAHIDAGKSTLADRFLELTQAVQKHKMQAQYLDQMELERERGITIKMAPVTMHYKDYTLNLIDTPGHVDFSYEVSRSLAAVEGAILLIDAIKGVQAQTVAHLQLAARAGLKIIPAINKIDLPAAQIHETEEEILALLMSLDITPQKVHKISSKTGEGVEELLQAVVKKVPAPSVASSPSLRAFIFDSVYDDFKGIISYVRVLEGEVKSGDEILFMEQNQTSQVKEVGIFSPQLVSAKVLRTGDIGYIVSGVKNTEASAIGDTITLKKSPASEAIPGYKEPQPVVFAGVHVSADADYAEMKSAFEKLKLNDSALYFEPEHSPTLGRGFKCGFLGMLHMEIVLERLRREYNLDLIVTAPSVSYKVELKNGEVSDIFNPNQYPDVSKIAEVAEPWVLLKIVAPPDYINNVMNLLKNLRGDYKDTEYLGSERIQINYETPLSEIIENFYNDLKNVTKGHASMAWIFSQFRPAQIVKLDILLAGDKVSSLSRLVAQEKAQSEARRLVRRIKAVIPRQQFALAIQAAVGGKVIARETKSAARKDVTAGLYGGDITRKRKQLEKQKKGKKRLASHGKVRLDPATMMKIFK